MEYIRGLQRTFIQYDSPYDDVNNYDACYFRFDIYADTNFWDSSILDSDRDLFLTLSLSSTDMYDNLKIMSWYSSSVYDSSSLTSFLNNSEHQYELTNNATNKTSYTYSTDFSLQDSSYLTDIGYSWNNAEYWNVILYYDSDDCFIDEAYINVTNKMSFPYYHDILSQGFDTGYNTGYQNGLDANQQNIFDTGYSEGFQTGRSQGYSEGSRSGFSVGYHSGYDAGYDVGLTDNQPTIYNNGYNTGYDIGYTGGYNTGYDVGHLDGISDAESGEYNLSNMVITVADTPINIFKTIFDVNFMGINLVPILFGITALGIIIWLIRRFMGGD